MTTIVAVQREGDVEFASDRQVSAGDSRSFLSSPKVFRNGDVVFGVSGPLRTLNILEHAELPEFPGEYPESWVIAVLIPALQNVLSDNRAIKEESGEHDTHSSILLAVDGLVFEVGSDFSVTRASSPFYAVGSGFAYALGALGAGADPEQAVRIASEFDVYTGGQIDVTSYSKLMA